jgi:hypothetical protein
MSFLYGNHVLKSGLGRITDNTPAYAGVVVCSMADVPLGFATTAKSTLDCRKLDPSGIVAFHQADTGEYLRKEDEMIGARPRGCVGSGGAAATRAPARTLTHSLLRSAGGKAD